MAQKLKFTPDPTFKFILEVPVAGSDKPGELTMTAKHLNPIEFTKVRLEATEAIKAAADVADDETQLKVMADCIQKLATGWAWDVEFSEENLILAMKNHPRFYDSYIAQYTAELWSVREKN